MKFKLGPIPENFDFNPETDGWMAIREPSPIWLQFLGLPILAAAAAITFAAIHFLTPISDF